MKFLSNQITVKDYQDRKPYNHFSDYDAFYLRHLHEVHNIISRFMHETKSPVSSEQEVELALMITGYFEDVMSDIGIWKALCFYHQKLYGRKIPIFEIDEELYDDDNI